MSFHGVFKPTGWERTYPNLLTSEGVLNLDRSRLEYWQKQGAQPSHTLSQLLKKNPAPPAQT